MDQLKDIVKKFGGFIELGGFALAFISVFLPFAAMSYYITISTSFVNADGWGVFVLILTILGAAYVAIDAFAPQVFKKLINGNKTIETVLGLVPLGIAGIAFLITFIDGLRYWTTSYVHVSVGFFFILIGLVVVIFIRVMKNFVIKNAFANLNNKPQAPVVQNNNNNMNQ